MCFSFAFVIRCLSLLTSHFSLLTYNKINTLIADHWNRKLIINFVHAHKIWVDLKTGGRFTGNEKLVTGFVCCLLFHSFVVIIRCVYNNVLKSSTTKTNRTKLNRAQIALYIFCYNFLSVAVFRSMDWLLVSLSFITHYSLHTHTIALYFSVTTCSVLSCSPSFLAIEFHEKYFCAAFGFLNRSE